MRHSLRAFLDWLRSFTHPFDGKPARRDVLKWIDPPLDPSFRVLRAHTPEDKLKWVCPPLDPSFKIHGGRQIGIDSHPDIPMTKVVFSDLQRAPE
jgi:hypothetical protein